MRIRIIKQGIGLLLLAMVVIIAAGCSDDVTPAGSNLTPGLVTDPQFQLIQGQINQYLDSTETAFSVGLENISHLPTDTEEVHNIHGPMGPNDTAQYTYANGWHVTYIAKYATNFSVNFRDSVQFKNDDVAVETPAPLDYMQYIRNWTITSNLVSETNTNLARYVNLTFADLDTDTATINGANNFDVEWNFISSDSTVSAVFDMDVTVSNIKVAHSNTYGWVSGCPCSGAINMSINQEYMATIGPDQVDISRTWTAAISIEGGVASVEITSNNETWSYTYTICTFGG